MIIKLKNITALQDSEGNVTAKIADVWINTMSVNAIYEDPNPKLSEAIAVEPEQLQDSEYELGNSGEVLGKSNRTYIDVGSKTFFLDESVECVVNKVIKR